MVLETGLSVYSLWVLEICTNVLSSYITVTLPDKQVETIVLLPINVLIEPVASAIIRKIHPPVSGSATVKR